MNEIKRKRRWKWLIPLILLITFSGMCFAEQLNVDFVAPASTIRTLGTYSDATLSIMNTGTGVIRVLKGGNLAPRAVGTDDPGNPIATYSGGNITGAVGDGGLGNGSYYFAHSTVNVTNGDSFFVRVWNATNQCYIDASPQSISWGDSPLPNYTLTYSAMNAYWARLPEAPTVSSVAESLRRNDKGTPDPADDTYDLTLTVTPAYSETTTHIQLAQTDATGPDGAHSKLRIHCYKATDPAPPTLTTALTDPRVQETNSGAVSFSGGAGYFTPGDYKVEVYAFNWFGHGGPGRRDWSTLSGGGGVLEVRCDFVLSGSLGINQFSIPLSSSIMFDSTTSVANLQALIDAIDTKAGPNTVKSVGWWDKTAQVMVGWVKKVGVWEPQNGAPATPAAEIFGSATKDKVYQMSVARNVSFTLSGNR